VCVRNVALVIWHTNNILTVTQYIVICVLSGSTIFFCVIFGKNLLNIKCVFWFYLLLLPAAFLILRRV